MTAITPRASSLARLVELVLGAAPSFILGIESVPFRGGEYEIYALELEADGRRVCVRVPRVLGPHTDLLLAREADLRRRTDRANI